MFLSALARAVAAVAVAVAAVGLAAPSHADDPDSDAMFSRLLDHQGLLFNFRLEKRQGQRFCESIIDGDTVVNAIHDLMRYGAYSFDVANGITTAAGMAYCDCTWNAREGIRVDQNTCRPFELEYQRR